MLTKGQTSAAINFFFPSLDRWNSTFERIEQFIHEEYAFHKCVVLYYKNKEFMKLLASEGLSIGAAEVIITEKAVRASDFFSNLPTIIYKV